MPPKLTDYLIDFDVMFGEGCGIKSNNPKKLSRLSALYKDVLCGTPISFEDRYEYVQGVCSLFERVWEYHSREKKNEKEHKGSGKPFRVLGSNPLYFLAANIRCNVPQFELLMRGNQLAKMLSPLDSLETIGFSPVTTTVPISTMAKPDILTLEAHLIQMKRVLGVLYHVVVNVIPRWTELSTDEDSPALSVVREQTALTRALYTRQRALVALASARLAAQMAVSVDCVLWAATSYSLASELKSETWVAGACDKILPYYAYLKGLNEMNNGQGGLACGSFRECLSLIDKDDLLSRAKVESNLEDAKDFALASRQSIRSANDPTKLRSQIQEMASQNKPVFTKGITCLDELLFVLLTV